MKWSWQHGMGIHGLTDRSYLIHRHNTPNSPFGHTTSTTTPIITGISQCHDNILPIFLTCQGVASSLAALLSPENSPANTATGHYSLPPAVTSLPLTAAFGFPAKSPTILLIEIHHKNVALSPASLASCHPAPMVDRYCLASPGSPRSSYGTTARWLSALRHLSTMCRMLHLILYPAKPTSISPFLCAGGTG